MGKGDLAHCESCHKWHTPEDMCEARMKEHIVKLEADLDAINLVLVSGARHIRELASRRHNSPIEQAWFDKLQDLLRKAVKK